MSAHEPVPQRRKKRARSGAAERPVCARCGRGMTVKQVTPVLFASNVDDMVFGCEDCGTETKRTVRRS